MSLAMSLCQTMAQFCIHQMLESSPFSLVSRIQQSRDLNSAPELEFIANSNWNLLPIPIPELELNWNCHHWNWIGIAITGIGIELELP